MKPTDLLQGSYRLPTLVDEGDLKWVKRLIDNFVRGAQGDHFDVVLDSNLAEDAMRILLGFRAQRECVFSLSVNRNTPYLIPWLSQELKTNAAVRSGRYML